MIGNVLVGIWNSIRDKMKWVLLLCLILVIPLGYGASLVKTKSGAENNLPSYSKEYKNIMVLKENFSDQNILIVLNGEVKDIASDQNLAAMKYITDDIAARYPKNVLFTISPGYFLDYLQQNGLYDPKTQTPEEVIVDPQTGKINERFSSIFLDPQNSMIVIGLWQKIDDDTLADLIDRLKKDIKDANFDSNVRPIMSGFPVVMSYIGTEVPKELNKLMMIAIIIMLFVLAFFFGVRGKIFRRWIVLGLVFVGIIYAFGVMGFIGMPLTACSMVAFPILLGLGVDYSVQFHNRYDEESRKGASANESVITTLRRTGPPIIMAMLLCIIGFASVLLLDNPQIRYFGFSLMLGVSICMIVSLILLLGILYRLDKPHDATRKPEPRHAGALERFMRGLTPRLVKFTPIILLAAIVASGLGWYYEDEIETSVGFTGSVRDNLQEYKDMNYVVKIVGGISPLDVVITADNVLEPEILNWVLNAQDQLYKEHGVPTGGHIGSVSSLASVFNDQLGGIPGTAQDAEDFIGLLPRNMWVSLVSEDRTALHVGVIVDNDGNEVGLAAQQQLREVFASPPMGAVATVTGMGTIGPYTSKSLDDSRRVITTYGVGFIILAAFFMFRLKIKRTLAAAFPVLLVLGWSALFMKVRGIKMSILMAMLPAAVMAIGVEFTILMLMRYYEERDKGETPMVAMTTAMTRIGRAILISGGMVIIVSAVMLLAFNLPFVQDFGIVAMLDTVLILVVTLCVLPPLVILSDRRRFGVKDEEALPSVEDMITKD